LEDHLQHASLLVNSDDNEAAPVQRVNMPDRT
jgi:hypothetical protein